jgi:hypothetical protein
MEDRLPKSSICTTVVHHGIVVTFTLLLTACSSNTPPQTHSKTPVILATETFAPTQIITREIVPTSTQTPKPQLLFNRIILVEVGNEIWAISHPFEFAAPLFQEENVIFGAAGWSHDGEWIAYAKATLDCPATGSIWISRYDGSDARQISPSIEGAINQETGDCTLISAFPDGPSAFSGDDTLIAAHDINGMKLISIETGETVRVSPRDAMAAEGIDGDFTLEWLQWRSFSATGDRALLSTRISDDFSVPPLLLWISFENYDQPTFLHPPPEFRFWYFPKSGPLKHIWSIDGRFILIPDETESGDQSRLWRINIETDEWEIVRTQPISFEYDELKSAAWSPDGRWAAWWSRSYNRGTKEYDFQILFLNTTTWEIHRSVLVEDLKGGDVLGWASLSNGETRLVLSKGAPESEIVLLDPLDGSGDQFLISYEQLDLLFGGDWRRVGPFQP